MRGMVGEVGLEPTTGRLSGATGYKPAALPTELLPLDIMELPRPRLCGRHPYSKGVVGDAAHERDMGRGVQLVKPPTQHGASR